MTTRIHLTPSGKEFPAESGETVLEAALRAGVSPAYSCHNGSCGECKARLLSGRVRHGFHDYVFSEADKSRGCILLCRAEPETDLEIEAHAAGGVEDIPLQQVPAKVTQLERVHADILVLHLRTPRSRTLRFLAGQHVSLEIEGLPARNKSIASCPCNAMHLQFHIRRVPGDTFSEYVFSALRPGQTINLNGPWGVFTLDEASRRPIVLLAYDTGFAPIQSIVEHAIALDLNQPMHLYWLVQRAGDHYLENYCRAWLDALDDFQYTPLTGGTASGAGEATAAPFVELPHPARDLARAGAAILADHPDIAGYDVYLSGPESLMAPTVALLRSHGLPEAQLRIDFLRRF